MSALRRLAAVLLFALTAAVHADEFSGAIGETPCSKKGYEPSEFKDPAAVWHGNREKARGPYIEFARTEIPAAPAAAPQFPAIYFDLDKAFLRPEGKAVADDVAAYLKANPAKKIVIEGHCCDWASDGYNQALGQRRADAVAAYLTAQGIDPARLTAISYGETKPAVENQSPARPLNRRAEILFRVE